MNKKSPNYALRPGTLDDADALAELINYAGEGMPHYLWGKMAQAGETAWDVGRRRACRDEGSFSYRNAVVADVEGEAVACLIGYVIPDAPVVIDKAMPAMFVPLQELENVAPSTWYINVLAAQPRFRGQGLGTKLILTAEEKAIEAGCKGLSIIVADANSGARSLYERLGYDVQATRPMVKEDWESPAANWVLLTKHFS